MWVNGFFVMAHNVSGLTLVRMVENDGRRSSSGSLDLVLCHSLDHWTHGVLTFQQQAQGQIFVRQGMTITRFHYCAYMLANVWSLTSMT